MQKGRRNKIRYIQKMPVTLQFSPRGKPGRPDEIELKIDEFEAFKLADYQGYDQSEGALAMGISRASFGRILRKARHIVANALVNGKIIRIRTANIQVGVRQRNFPIKYQETHPKLTLQTQVKEEAIRRNIFKYPSYRKPNKPKKDAK